MFHCLTPEPTPRARGQEVLGNMRSARPPRLRAARLVPLLPLVLGIGAGLSPATALRAQTIPATVCTLEGRPVDAASPSALRGMSGRLLCRDGATGKVTRDATFDEGLQVGLSRLFYPDGRLRRAAFSAGVGGDRAAAEFTPRGSLSLLRCADKPLLQPAVDDARLCGFNANSPATVDLFDEQEVRRARVTHLDGRRLRTERYYDNGVVASQEELSGNQRTERQFASDGTRRSETIFALERGRAQRVGAKEFSANGLLLRDQVWGPADELVRDDLYFADSGGPRRTTRYQRQGNERWAEVVEYFASGQVAFRGRYLAPPRAPLQPTGTHQRFDAQGALAAESIYSATGKLLRERAWAADGQLMVDDTIDDATAQGSAKPGAPNQ